MKIQIFKILVTIAVLIFLIFSALVSLSKEKELSNIKNEDILISLPSPELDSGQRGVMGIDKNVNEMTLDIYLNRADSVYYDVRMLIDPAKFENIGGDSHLSGYVDGFEIIPYPYLAPVTGLPKQVGKGYSGPTLFSFKNGTYIPNYKESLNIIENIFPKDKYIFLMCGAGGYAGSTKELLVACEWNPALIYNVGGYWYYEGNHKIETYINGEYQFWKVPYHEIDFNKLTKIQ